MKFDTDHDGKLSREELIVGLEQTLGHMKAEEEVNMIMEQVDSDLNGFIDYNEFVAATMDKAKLLSKKNLDAAFSTFDRDGSGTLTVDEIKLMLGGNTARESVWTELIKQCDGNGDGVIDIKEFKVMMMNIL
jgi:Ca2+-binding EF-hand superfamily protein